MGEKMDVFMCSACVWTVFAYTLEIACESACMQIKQPHKVKLENWCHFPSNHHHLSDDVSVVSPASQQRKISGTWMEDIIHVSRD